MPQRRAPIGYPALLALPALAMATSCVPTPQPVATATIPSVTVRPETDGRALLRKLALGVPDGLADVPLPLTVPTLPVAAPPPFVGLAQTPDDASRAAQCLTAAVYYEARSEPLDGQRAVAQVVLNRVRDRAFPASVCGVVYQGSNRSTGCQFSFTCDGSMNHPLDPGAWARAAEVARAALAGDVYAPIGSATHYHASYVSPWWAPSLTRVATIGAHIFYRWSGALERALAFRQTYAGVEPAVTAAAAAGSDVAGVAIHRGGEDEMAGVTIHRGGSVPEADAAAAPDDGPAPAGSAATEAPRPSTVAGVHIHVGTAAAGANEPG